MSDGTEEREPGLAVDAGVAAGCLACGLGLGTAVKLLAPAAPWSVALGIGLAWGVVPVGGVLARPLAGRVRWIVVGILGLRVVAPLADHAVGAALIYPAAVGLGVAVLAGALGAPRRSGRPVRLPAILCGLLLCGLLRFGAPVAEAHSPASAWIIRLAPETVLAGGAAGQDPLRTPGLYRELPYATGGAYAYAAPETSVRWLLVGVTGVLATGVLLRRGASGSRPGGREGEDGGGEAPP